MTKIPKHLLKKIDELARSFDMFASENWQEEQEAAFKAGSSAMHSLMLEELKPIVEALECYARDNAKTTTNECGTGVVTCMAEKALAHFKERIEWTDEK